MAIYAAPPAPFDCVICGKRQMLDIWDKHRGADTVIPPLCMHCEKTFGKSVGGWGDRNRDRRMIRQVSALAEIIICTAYCKQNGHRVPYERA